MVHPQIHGTAFSSPGNGKKLTSRRSIIQSNQSKLHSFTPFCFEGAKLRLKVSSIPRERTRFYDTRMDIKSSKWEYGWRKCRGICSFYDHRGRSHCCCCSLPDSSQRFYSRKSQRNVIGKSDCKKINRESNLSAGSVQYTFLGLRSKHRSRTNRSVVP